jgi:hypothetical protein
MIYNPSLRQEHKNQRAALIPMQQESSILDWLESSGRLLARDNADFDYLDDEEEINELMDGSRRLKSIGKDLTRLSPCPILQVCGVN